MNQSISVLVISDYRLFAETIAIALRKHKDIILVGLTTDPEEIFIRFRPLLLDVVLVHTTTENMYLLQMIMEIKEEFPNVKVIIVGMEQKEEVILDFIEAGANGYIMKEASFDELLHTIRAVYHEQTLCSPRIVASVFSRIAELSWKLSRREILPQIRLTPREKEILELIALGRSNNEIAQQLGITLYTAKNHVHNILDKLQVHYRRDAILWAYENGILEGSHPYWVSVAHDQLCRGQNRQGN